MKVYRVSLFVQEAGSPHVDVHEYLVIAREYADAILMARREYTGGQPDEEAKIRHVRASEQTGVNGSL